VRPMKNFTRRIILQPGKGMPRPTVHKHTITPTLFMPHVYSREVRRQYTGEELRQLRKERGVGQVRRISRAVAEAA
jgi:hypothetical protein